MSSKQKPSSAAPRKPKSTASSPVKNTYFLAYNTVSAALWAGVLYKTVTIGSEEVINQRKAGQLGFGKQHGLGGLEALGSGKVYGELEQYTRLTQSLALLEVLHSLLGK